jgi:acyl-CoA oxidase
LAAPLALLAPLTPEGRTELARLLDGPEAEPWRVLAGDPVFLAAVAEDPHGDAAPVYARLRSLARRVPDGRALAADPVGLAALHQWFAPLDPDLVTVAGIHYNLFLGSLVDHAGGEAARPLDAYARAERIGTFLCTELAHGNDAPAMETTARWTGDGFTLSTPHAGAQKFMPNTTPTGGPKSALVAARLVDAHGMERGVHLFLTDLQDAAGRPLPGIRTRELPSRTGSRVDHALTWFDDVRLPPSALLTKVPGRIGPEGVPAGAAPGGRRARFHEAIARVVTGKLCMSASAVGGSRFALALALSHAERRSISGFRRGERVPLAAHRSHHAPLVEALATTYAMSLLHRETLRRFAADPAGSARDAAVAKAWICWRAREVLLACRERCGAQGLLAHNLLPGLLAGAEGTITAEGDNLAIALHSAASLLAAHPAPAPVPASAAPGSPAPASLAIGDPARLRALLAATEHAHAARAREAMAGTARTDALARWNAGSEEALAALDARAAGRAADALLAALDELPRDSPQYALLRSLTVLFCLVRLAPETGRLLAAGHLAPSHVAAIDTLRGETVRALAPHARALTEPFGLPPALLASVPLGQPEPQAFYDDPEGPWHRPRVPSPAHGGEEHVPLRA